MTLSIAPLSPIMGALARGVDLRTPPDATLASALNRALDEHAVLCIRDQQLTPPELLSLAQVFGTPERQVNKSHQLAGFPEIGILSSETTDVHGTRKRVINGTTWHTDHSFTARPPKATLLYALQIPSRGGDTSFCNMRAAYAALPEETKRTIGSLRAVHRYQSSRSPRKMMARTAEEMAETPDVTHPLVRQHLPTGTKALYMSTTRLERIEGLAREDSDALIDQLLAHATQPCFVYHHEWQLGDAVIWDNRCTMHHANADYSMQAQRLMHRVLIDGEVPI